MSTHAPISAQDIIGVVKADIPSDLPLREWLYAWLFDPHIEGNHHHTFERWIGYLIVANILALVCEHIPQFYLGREMYFHAFEVVVDDYARVALLRTYDKEHRLLATIDKIAQQMRKRTNPPDLASPI